MASGTPSSPQLQQIVALLQSGNPSGSLSLIDEMRHRDVSLPPQPDWVEARAASMVADRPREQSALLRILERDRRDIPAMLAMGQLKAATGDVRSAASWYRAALNQASNSQVPQALHAGLAHAQSFCEQSQRRLAEEFAAALDGTGVGVGGSPALRHAIDLLYGRSEIFLQQPSMFYYPGLPQRCFYERQEFDWVAGLEAQAEALRDEFLALLERSDQPFAPYIRRGADRPASSSALLENENWGAAYLWQGGQPTELSRHCPQTMAALADAPLPHVEGRSPMALYSRLKPGTHITAHHGLLNTRLICHLPLIAPEGCALRCGHETRSWHFGKMLIFDDSVEHEAWNRGSSDRTILLFEIWRPEIPEDDRHQLATLFAAIDQIDPERGKEQE